MRITTDNWPYPAWIAHRGAGRLAPENTLAACRLGASYGYRMFECDVKLSQDGVPFLLHDDTLNRTTNAQGVAGEQDWRQLAQLDAGSWHSRSFAGEPLPTLANIARFCIKNSHFLNIEIKPTPGLERKTGEVIALHATRLWEKSATPAAAPPLLTSFRPESLEGAKATAPRLPRGLLLDTLWKGWLETALMLDCVAIICDHKLWDTSSVTQAKSAGFRCLSYTVNDEWAAQRLLNLGTDGIITDRVDLFSPT
ncbi:MAG: glycerophosphodiester phosphodiesterase [Burkholderiaceae bacterium]|nr:glycerophosphodiester phosphodiesterase [Burkholderiaceae bacterium]